MSKKTLTTRKCDFNICKNINFAKREYSKGIVFNALVKKGFFTSGNGVWRHIDASFKFHLQFSHFSYQNAVHINNGKMGEFNLWKYKYTKTKWINELLHKVDVLLEEHQKMKLEIKVNLRARWSSRPADLLINKV